MRQCDYAACTRIATERADGWRFCTEHLRHHRALTGRGPFPIKAPAIPLSAFAEPCGTAAAYARHRRRGETACDACKDAHTRRRHGYTSSAKKWHGIAS